MRQRLKNQLLILWPSAKPGGYSRSGEVAALVMLLRLDCQSRITNHFSTFHLSLFTNPLLSHQSLLTSHGRDSGLAVRLQDLFLILSQCVDLGLLSITAAFRAARDLKKILGSGFEMIRISQCESLGPPGVPRAFARASASTDPR
jgi:hypothetical protein